MKIWQTTIPERLYGITIPAWGLMGFQKPTKTKPARYVWVQDVRTCGLTRFRIWCMNCATDEVYSYYGDVARDSIARLFARFADSLPLESIRKPEWDSAGDYAPQDRKPQRFDALRARPCDGMQVTERSVVDGCIVGKRRYSEVGYWARIS